MPLPYEISVTTITCLSTTVWAACPCPTAYALLVLHDYVRLCEQLALALRHTRYYCYMTTYDCVSSLPLPYGIRITTIKSLRTTVWAACPCPTAYELLLLCEQPALPVRHMRYYYYLNTYYCVSSLPLPYGIRVTTITWLRTTVWAACLLRFGIRVTSIKWPRTTVWAACLCPTAYALLQLHDYVRLYEQLALALRHTHYYYYMTTYDCVSSLPLSYLIRVTTFTSLHTTVWAACPCPTHTRYYYYVLCEQPVFALRHMRYYY